jgi:stearoyl-CoA desaturase (delta-9 desaturase)
MFYQLNIVMNLSRTHTDPILLSAIGILFPVWTVYWVFLNFSLSNIALVVIGSWLLGINISMFAHRNWCHKAWSTNTFINLIGLFVFTVSLVGNSIGWVGIHREHHRFTDTEKDPHSPLYKSRWRIQFLSYFNPVKLPYIVDVGRSNLHLWFYKHYWYINLIFVMLLGVTSIDFLLFWIAVIGLTIFKLHIVNSLSHATPKFLIPMNSSTNISNSLVLGVLFVNSGEAWHKNHHDDPKNARFGKHWYQIDIPFMLIKCLVFCNLATIE